MTLTFEEILQLRTGIIEYVGKFDAEQLKTLPLDGLLTYLAATTGREVPKDDLNNLFYNKRRLGINDQLNGNNPVFYLSNVIGYEEASLKRIEQIIGKQISSMNDTELEQAAIQMFMFPYDQYEPLADNLGIEKDDTLDLIPVSWREDSSLLIDYLAIQGKSLDHQHLRNKVLATDFGLGYMDNMFKKKFAYESKEGYHNYKIDNLHYQLHSNIITQKQALAKHLAADQNLTAKHTLAPPQLLSDMTLDLDIIPYSIDFTPDGKLVVLGGKVNTKDEDRDSSKMLLNVYDINTGKLLQSTNTNLHSRFEGVAGTVSSFQGNLTVGQDGIIYVNGGSKRYSVNLEELIDNESNYCDAIDLLNDQDILNYNKEIFQVVQADNIFYFALQPSSFPVSHNNTLVATDGKKIIGTPIINYSPNGGMGNNAWDETPRIVVHNNDIYLKASQHILAVDRSLTEEAIKNRFIMAHPTKYYSSIPSNHCLSPAGVLYAVNQFEEEAAQSIQGYVRGKEHGEFATHVYPETYPGGWASLRSMAISKDNLLAYTCLDGNKINLYQLVK